MSLVIQEIFATYAAELGNRTGYALKELQKQRDLANDAVANLKVDVELLTRSAELVFARMKAAEAEVERLTASEATLKEEVAKLSDQLKMSQSEVENLNADLREILDQEKFYAPRAVFLASLLGEISTYVTSSKERNKEQLVKGLAGILRAQYVDSTGEHAPYTANELVNQILDKRLVYIFTNMDIENALIAVMGADWKAVVETAPESEDTGPESEDGADEQPEFCDHHPI